MIIKSFDKLTKTPEMIADEAGRRLVDHVINRTISHPKAVFNEAHRFGSGEKYVRATKHFEMALILTS